MKDQLEMLKQITEILIETREELAAENAKYEHFVATEAQIAAHMAYIQAMTAMTEYWAKKT